MVRHAPAAVTAGPCYSAQSSMMLDSLLVAPGAAPMIIAIAVAIGLLVVAAVTVGLLLDH